MPLADRIEEKKTVKLSEIALAHLQNALLKVELRRSELGHAQRNLQDAERAKDELVGRLGNEFKFTPSPDMVVNFDSGEIEFGKPTAKPTPASERKS